jgi:hypothetical protein
MHAPAVRSDGTGRSSRRRVRLGATVPGVVCFVLLFAVLVPVAQAAGSRAYQFSFGFFSSPAALTVDQQTGDVYEVDNASGLVRRYDSTGAAKDFTAGPDTGTNTLGGTSPFVFFGVAGGVAVDDSGGSSDGDIYVLDLGGPSSTGELHVYSNTGALLGSVDGTGTPNGSFAFACGVTVDQANGDVYIGDANDFTNGLVLRYSPSGGAVVESDYSGGIKAAGPICGVAVAQGHLYTADTFAFGDVRSYATSDFATGAPPPSPSSTLIDSGVNAIAADPANGDVYVDKGESISVFSSSGSSLYSFGLGDFGGSLGVAVGGPAGGAYVADGNAAEIDAYGPFVAGSAPATATTTTATQITHVTATLGGHLDPGDDSSVTACHFDYLSASDFSANGDSYSGPHTPVTVPCTEGNSYTAPADVSANLTGLHPGATYHYHLRITGSVTGEVTGEDQTLTTTTFPVTTDPASTIHHTDVVLNGDFDPEGDPALNVTACSFDWVTDAQFQIDQFASAQTAPCAEGQSFNSPASVSAFINNLTPGAGYHYRLHLVTAGAGENVGQERTVTPPLFPTVAPQIAAFGPDGTSATSFGQFNLSSLAFDQVNRRLYASERGANPATDPGSIYGFDASASPAFPSISGFNPLATAPIVFLDGLAVDNTVLGSGGDLYLADRDTGAGTGTGTGKVLGFDSTGAALGGDFPIDPAVTPGAPAGSPKGLCGAAVDSAGELWVANGATGRLLRYSSAGVFQSSLDVSTQIPSAGIGPCRIAFDSNDDLYVAQLPADTWRLTAASGYTAATQIEPASAQAQAIAVDPSTHDLYVAHSHDVTRYDAAGNPQATFATGIPGASFDGVTVDATSHDVYVADGGNDKIRVFHANTQRPPTITPGAPTAITGDSAMLNAKVDPETFTVTDCHFEWGTTASYGNTVPCSPDPGSGSGDVAVHADIAGLNAGSTYHFRIVASNAQAGGTATGADQAFTTLGPAISGTTATDITDGAAILRAQVNPGGHSTTYRFEYGADTSYGQTAPPAPAAIGSGSSPVPLAERIGGLQPATTYHFRVVAISSDGADVGSDATFTTFGSSPPGGPDSCPNAALRTGPSAALPDCRAYEQVSPVDKHGSAITGRYNFNQASADGQRAVFGSYGDLPSSGGHGSQAPAYVAGRGPSGWSYDSTTPNSDPGLTSIKDLGRDPDLRVSLSAVSSNSGDSLFSTDLTTFDRRPLFSVPQGGNLFQDPQFAADLSHFIFESADSLAPGAVSGKRNLYDYDHGALTLAGMVPAFPATSCTAGACVAPPAGSFAGSYDLRGASPGVPAGNLDDGFGYKQDTISADGSRVFFTEGATGRLYERVDGVSTTQISADQGGNDPNGHKPAAFWAATPSGSQVFFTSCERLTPDSTAVSTVDNECLTSTQGQDLYAYDTSSGDLTDLTPDASPSDPKGAQVQGVLGASPDGSYLYFAANGVLAPGASPGDCENNQSATGSLTGFCSLYLYHAGDVSFVARLGQSLGTADPFSDYADWVSLAVRAGVSQKTSRVAAGGALIFSSTGSLTGYDSTGPCGHSSTLVPCPELYRYDPQANGGTGVLGCVSCDPTGARPTGDAGIDSDAGSPLFRVPQLGILTRVLSADGTRVFFETPDKLVPADVNGDAGCPTLFANAFGGEVSACQDVYEWEAEGSGSCHSHAQDGGCLYLLSSGTGSAPSRLDDASASGDDVFIYTDDRFVPQDKDQLTDLYDVRVDGGLPAQHTSSPPPCTGDPCQGTPSAPAESLIAGSVTFAGAGNASAPPGVLVTPGPKVSSRTVRGSSAALSIKVPSSGRLTVSGTGLRSGSVTAAKAGTYELRVRLSAKARRAWQRAHVLKVKAVVRFTPSHGAPTTAATVTLTFRTATSKRSQ